MRRRTLLSLAAGLLFSACAGSPSLHLLNGVPVPAGTAIVIAGLPHDQERIPVTRKLQLFGFKVVPPGTPDVHYTFIAAFPNHGPDDEVCVLTIVHDGRPVLRVNGVALPKREYVDLHPGDVAPLEQQLFQSAFYLFARRLFGDLDLPGYP